jgi:hypothetical protein
VALITKRGEVIGVVTASLNPAPFLERGDVPQNVNYAVKADYISILVPSLAPASSAEEPPRDVRTSSAPPRTAFS